MDEIRHLFRTFFNASAVLLSLSSGSHAASPGLAEIDRLYFYRHEGHNLEESIGRLEKLWADDPKDAAVLWRWGRSLVRLGERQAKKKEKIKLYELGEEKVKKAVALNPDDAEAHFWLGLAMGRRGQARGILNSLFLVGPIRREMEAALKLNPGHGGAHRVLGEILRELPRFAGGDKKAAVREMEEAVRLSPNFTANYVALAETYLAVGEKEKARAALEKVGEINEPDDPAEYPDDLKDAERLLKKL